MFHASSFPILLAAFALLAAAGALAQQKSPKGDILVESERLNDGDPRNSVTRKVWLVSTSDPSKRELLFTHYRGADVVFSPNEEWLVINDRPASNEAGVLLYQRKEGLRYDESADISDAAWEFFWKQNGGETQFGFDHHYVECVQWLRKQPSKILLTLRGHMDSRTHALDWRCLYDTKTQTFSLIDSLKEHNKGRAVIEHR